jgi:hypothetical protein
MSRTTAGLPLCVVAIAAAAAIAGCGSNSSSGSSSGGPPTQAHIQQEQQDVVRFAVCMRSHGVPNLPDPATDPHEFKNAFNTQSPAFKSAEAACQHLVPGGGQHTDSAAQVQTHTAALLAFARCLRTHGFPTFPDPTSSGQVTHEMVASAGINLQQPAVLQAADACVSVTHGVITRAIVARFVAGH